MKRSKIICKKLFWYARFIGKCAGLPFILAGVFLLILQFLPTYKESGVIFIIFVVGAVAWGFDTLFTTLDDITKLLREHDINRHGKTSMPV
jgi:hypothetical protein